jgi:carboxymethylenebutenolidase
VFSTATGFDSKAAYHIGIATDRDSKQPNDKVALREALDAARVTATLEVYPGTRHGWMVSDTDPYNHQQAERGWPAMVATLQASACRPVMQ